MTKLTDYKPLQRNPNKGTQRGTGILEQSVRELGAGRSILVDKNGVILAGNHAQEAFVNAGMDDVIEVETDGKKIVVVKRTDLDAESSAGKKMAIMDNRTSEQGLAWDAVVVEDLLNEIKQDEGELDAYLESLAKDTGAVIGEEPPEDAGAQIDKAEELRVKWGVELGQLWQLGEHRLICGDCTDNAVVDRVMGGEKAECLWTDPPYNVNYEGNYIQSGKILEAKEKIWLGGIDNDALTNFEKWLINVYQTIDEFMEDGCAIYIWHPPGAEGRHFWSAWLWDAWHFQVDLVWNKTSLIISRWDYKPQHEPFMYGWKGKNRQWSGSNNEPTVWDYPRQQGRSGEDRYHPTQKFPELAERSIMNHDAQIILDPFLGSGTTLIACERLNRKCRAVEISPAYCAVAIQRWVDMTGQEPVLLDTKPTP